MSGQYGAGMHRTRTLAAAVTALALAATLTGCGGEEQPETTPAAAVPTTATAAASTPAPASSPTPAVLAVGDSTTFLDGAVTTTVLAYRQPAGSRGIPDPDRAGDTWGAIEVKVCTKPTSEVISVSTALWVLTYADGAVLEPSGVSYSQLPQPRYPWADHEVRPGRCVRGWITYEVPAKLRPAYVQYQPDGQAATEWQVK